MDEKTQKAILVLIARPYLNLTPDEKVSIAQAAARLMINELSGLLGDNMTIPQLQELYPNFQEEFSDIATLRGLDLITTKHAKEIMIALWENPGLCVIDYLRDSKILDEAQGDTLLPIIDAAIASNAQAAMDYRNGVEKALGRIVGQVLKAAGGKANPNEVKELLSKRIMETVS